MAAHVYTPGTMKSHTLVGLTQSSHGTMLVPYMTAICFTHCHSANGQFHTGHCRGATHTPAA